MLPSHADRCEKRVGYKSLFSTIPPIRQVIPVFVGGQVSEEWKEGRTLLPGGQSFLLSGLRQAWVE